MAKERCTKLIHIEDPRMRVYDWAYYKQLMPLIHGDVLDVGCGAGIFIEHYSKDSTVKSVLAIDKYLQDIPELPKVETKEWMSPEKIPTRKKFNTIVSTEFVEHIKREEFEPLLIQINKLLKKDGIFIGSTPNKIAPTTNPYHLYEYTLAELLSIMRKYFSEVEAWDNGQFCTLWKAKK